MRRSRIASLIAVGAISLALSGEYRLSGRRKSTGRRRRSEPNWPS